MRRLERLNTCCNLHNGYLGNRKEGDVSEEVDDSLVTQRFGDDTLLCSVIEGPKP